MEINENTEFPKITINTQTGEKGITILKKIVENDFGWLFRPNHQEADFGIDGYLDIITESGQVTGKSIAFQLKSGKSYFTEENEIGIVFKGNIKHLNYYLNNETPIIIIVLDVENELAYWEAFDKTKTEKSGNNWKMTIPKNNLLNVKSKNKLLEYVGPITDYISQMENEWGFNQILKKGSNRILFRIPNEEITNNKFDFITSALERIQRTPELVLHLKNRVDICFDDYEDNNKELFEIEEVKNWIIQLYQKTNCWAYLFSMDRHSGFMKILFFCHIPILSKTIVNGRFKIDFETEFAKEFIDNLFGKLNQYCIDKNLSQQTNIEMTNKIISCYFEE
ncbi:DUF4365 and DUF1817 domain-containing protein [Flavobacterium bomense]|uniref:DUF4365 and DUF1817 domain-containing protein n=1 Tax=Flavobacterium bomense TaxID=2497483 RepID=A0A3S0PI17_9FLAO|nr:DUF4365 and DUF1817 domain-containing protein [Flavobacterium bomense]RTZ03604.1 DUF4365 and DUF1817 domain-containing protein [Flavobacterium bomense]